MDKSAQDICVTDPPSAQSAVSSMDGWVSKFPESACVTAGDCGLFEDARAVWAMEKLGGCEGKSILELGPLEGGHSYMLHKAGAGKITAVEANRSCFLKCLITKEIMNLHRAEFHCGNFIPFMRDSESKYDIVWASGVLYHLLDPVELLELIAELADKAYIWTHYIPDGEYSGSWPAENLNFMGENIRCYMQNYGAAGNSPKYCGGVSRASSWLRRSDILRILGILGFDKITIGFEDVNHKNGSCFALAIERTCSK